MCSAWAAFARKRGVPLKLLMLRVQTGNTVKKLLCKSSDTACGVELPKGKLAAAASAVWEYWRLEFDATSAVQHVYTMCALHMC
jgi:hypothetical protein